jgi:hypothetical protein
MEWIRKNCHQGNTTWRSDTYLKQTEKNIDKKKYADEDRVTQNMIQLLSYSYIAPTQYNSTKLVILMLIIKFTTSFYIR